MMTRKDSVNTAEILFRVKHAVSQDIHNHLVTEFAEMFKLDNPNFDPQRFYDACK